MPPKTHHTGSSRGTVPPHFYPKKKRNLYANNSTSFSRFASQYESDHKSAGLIPWISINGEIYILLGLERRDDQGLSLTICGGKHSENDLNSLHTAIREFEEETGYIIQKALDRSTTLFPDGIPPIDQVDSTYWSPGKYMTYFVNCGKVDEGYHNHAKTPLAEMGKWVCMMLTGGKKNLLYRLSFNHIIRNRYLNANMEAFRALHEARQGRISLARQHYKQYISNRSAYRKQQTQLEQGTYDDTNPLIPCPEAIPNPDMVPLSQPRIAFPQFPFTHLPVELCPPPYSFDDIYKSNPDPSLKPSIRALALMMLPLFHHYHMYMGDSEDQTTNVKDIVTTLQAIDKQEIPQSSPCDGHGFKRRDRQETDATFQLDPYDDDTMKQTIALLFPQADAASYSSLSIKETHKDNQGEEAKSQWEGHSDDNHITNHEHDDSNTMSDVISKPPCESSTSITHGFVHPVYLWPPITLRNGDPFSFIFIRAYPRIVSHLIYIKRAQLYADAAKASQSDRNLTSILSRNPNRIVPTDPDRGRYQQFDINVKSENVEQVKQEVEQALTDLGYPLPNTTNTTTKTKSLEFLKGVQSSPSQHPPFSPSDQQYFPNPDASDRVQSDLRYASAGYDKMVSLHWVNVKSFTQAFNHTDNSHQPNKDDIRVFRNYSTVISGAISKKRGMETTTLVVTSNGLVLPLGKVAEGVLNADETKWLLDQFARDNN